MRSIREISCRVPQNTWRGNLQSAALRAGPSCLPSSPSSSSCLPFSPDLLRLSSAFRSLLWSLSSFSLAISALLRWTPARAIVWVPAHSALHISVTFLYLCQNSLAISWPLQCLWTTSIWLSLPVAREYTAAVPQGTNETHMAFLHTEGHLRGFCGACCSLKSQRNELHKHHAAPVRIWTNQTVWLNRRKVGGSVWTCERFKYFFHVSMDNV